MTPTLLNRRYRLIAGVATDETGEQYLALDEREGTAHIVSVWHTSGSDETRQVLKRVRAVQQIEHEAWWGPLEAGSEPEHPERPWAVWATPPGESIEQLVRRKGSLRIDRVVAMFLSLTEALRHAAGRGVAHGGITPDHVRLVSPEIARDQVVLTAPVIVPGRGGGPFNAPEHRLAANPGVGADLYGLGATLFYALTGLPPMSLAGSRQDLLRSPRAVRAEVPRALDDLVCGLLQQSPEKRPDLAEVRDILRSVRAEYAPPHKPIAPVGRFTQSQLMLAMDPNLLSATRRMARRHTSMALPVIDEPERQLWTGLLGGTMFVAIFAVMFFLLGR